MIEFILCMIVMEVSLTEARVKCFSPKSLPWTARGASCPVRCSNVLEAVLQLREMDLREAVNIDKAIELDSANPKILKHGLITQLAGKEGNEVMEPHSSEDKTENKDNLIYPTPKITADEKLFKVLHHELSKIAKNISCIDVIENKTLKSDANNANYTAEKCNFRRVFRDDFVTNLQAILHRHTKYKLNKNFIYHVLKKMYGDSIGKGVLQIPKILKYIHAAVQRQLKIKLFSKKRNFKGIELHSRDCFRLRIPGCYCIKGFVERDGECVDKKQCLFGVYPARDVFNYAIRIKIY